MGIRVREMSISKQGSEKKEGMTLLTLKMGGRDHRSRNVDNF